MLLGFVERLVQAVWTHPVVECVDHAGVSDYEDALEVRVTKVEDFQRVRSFAPAGIYVCYVTVIDHRKMTLCCSGVIRRELIVRERPAANVECVTPREVGRHVLPDARCRRVAVLVVLIHIGIARHALACRASEDLP